VIFRGTGGLLYACDCYCSRGYTSEANLKIKPSCGSRFWVAPVANLVTIGFHQNWS
jgi:hypothetical protein